MSPWSAIATAWDPEPTVIAGCGLLLFAYRRWVADAGDPVRTCSFTAGVLVLLLALISPLDVLSDEYLFSAHMLQHQLLVLVVPPLLLVGLPPAFTHRMLGRKPIAATEHVLGRPGVAFAIGMSTLWLWHLPVLYNATLASESLHAFEHLTFLVSATVFWWPLLAPSGHLRLEPWAGVGYLFLGAVTSGLLGIILTFMPAGLYVAYLEPDDSLHILSWLRQGLGITPGFDQQLGGLFMWIGGTLVFLVAILGVVAAWARGEEEETRGAPCARRAVSAEGLPSLVRSSPVASRKE